MVGLACRSAAVASQNFSWPYSNVALPERPSVFNRLSIAKKRVNVPQ
jgi:hypothetical protein